MNQSALHAGVLRTTAAFVFDAFVMFLLLLALFFIGTIMFHENWWFLAWVVVAVIYLPLSWASKRQASLGESAFGVKVTGSDGQRIGLGRAFARVTIFGDISGTELVDVRATPEQVVAGYGGTMPLTPGVWVTNIAFVLAIALVVFVVIPMYKAVTLRGPMRAMLTGIDEVRLEVDQALRDKRVPPEHPAKMPPHVKSVTIKPNGEFAAEVDPELFPSGRVLLKPEGQPGALTWTCTAENIPSKYLPATCR